MTAISKPSSLGHMPTTEKWEFDGSVTEVFDDMLARSIPQYDVMRELTFDLGKRYVQKHTHVLDLGCSRGEALAPFVQEFGATMFYTGVDMSKPMLEAARKRFQPYINSLVVDIREWDLRNGPPRVEPSVTLSVLTLMFTPIQYRQSIIRDVYRNLRPGGAFLLVEKVLGADADIDAVLVDRYHRMKADNGYSEEEIKRKALALEGVQVPVTAAWNEELLRMAGFRHVDCYWRCLNFAGWLAVKE